MSIKEKGSCVFFPPLNIEYLLKCQRSPVSQWEFFNTHGISGGYWQRSSSAAKVGNTRGSSENNEPCEV